MTRTLTCGLAAALVAAVLLGGAVTARAAVTDAQVTRAIEKGKEYLISQRNGDGSIGKGLAGDQLLAFMTLAYMGLHPNRPVIGDALDWALAINPDGDLDGRPGGHKCRGYSLPIRTMALSYVHNKLLGDRRNLVRQKMMEDILRYQIGQTTDGGWRYGLDATNWDFSVTQWPILAMRDASLVGIEIPEEPLRKAQKLYYEKQNADGGWSYQGGRSSYGSMTAAGVASVYIIADLLDPGSGCPCAGGRSSRTASEADRRIDNGLEWLSKNYTAKTNPGKGGHHLYWLYCVERVGIAAGYKYFGDHDWYAEGADYLVGKQNADGSWGGINETCFALLVLYKGRAPVLFNKLEFDGLWNMHRRDIAHLTRYIERIKEQLFHWQIVELRAPLEELHDAPILYITAESAPTFTDEEKAKLRAFTDTGGTILFEASCGNAAVKSWFEDFAREMWPEWKLLNVGRDDPVWSVVYPMDKRPHLMAVNDGVRNAVFYAPDDISCAWNTKAYASKGYLFDWGINLYTYATDGAPLRAKLAAREPEKRERHTGPINGGTKSAIRLARVRHGGNWAVSANYDGFERLGKTLSAAGVTLDVDEPKERPVTEGGGAPATLLAAGGYDVAFLTSSEPFTLTDAEREGLKAFAAGGGFLWAEAATGSVEFDRALKAELEKLGWTLELLPNTHGLMTGRMGAALGRNVSNGVEFRRALRVRRLGRAHADFWGIRDAAGKMVGVYSPFDTMFCITPYEACRIKGYVPVDAEAVATNIVLYATTLP